MDVEKPQSLGGPRLCATRFSASELATAQERPNAARQFDPPPA